MNIQQGKQLNIDELKNQEIDFFLFASNHEKRVFTAYDRIKLSNNISKTIAFCYNTKLKKNRDKKIDYHVINNHQEISSLLDDQLSIIDSKDIKIVMDYSCMTKSWYYTLILYLKKKKTNFNSVTVYFVYTPSIYAEPKEPKPNTEIAPLPGKYIVPTDKPKALIVCLGYEQSKAEGIIDHLDPKKYFIFYSKPALDDNFVSKIEENNFTLLKNNKAITFPLNDLHFLERELTSLYYLLRDEYSIIIAPLGPKPFTFISMLMTIRFNDIDIWRVGSGSDINKYDREPINDNSFIISEVIFK